MFSDMFHMPDNSPADLQMFTANTSNVQRWSTWKKPKGSTMTCIFAMSCGGNGGTGFSRASGNPGGGGGGGSNSPVGLLLIPSLFLPDSLFIVVGSGGYIGNTYISFQPDNTFVNGITFITVGNGGTGLNGSASSGGSGGSSGPAAAFFGISLLGLFNGSNTVAGGNGGVQTGANGTSITFMSSVNQFIPCPGAGGAGCNSSTNFAGGNITSPDTTIFPTISGGATGAVQNNGSSGIHLIKSILGPMTGGSGGNSNDSGHGGNGGDAGGYGCGGGGGGAGTTGGSGGRGGDGIAVVCSW